MDTLSSAVSQAVRDNFDTGPLSWVMGEIREALSRSKAALHEALTQETDSQLTSMRHAKTYLHQAHGALQIVDVDGVAIITETIEDLLERIDAKHLMFTKELVQVIENGYQALIEYLEELLSGLPHQPIRLFPYYRALLQARGAERIHPADLFFPNLAVRPQLPATDRTSASLPTDYVGLRQRFEKALLPFLKQSEHGAELKSAAAMRDIIGEVEKMQTNQQARSFWWVLHGFADGVASDQIASEIYVKQLFGRINLQIRRLSQGSSSIAERLLRDALFFIAQIKNPSPQAKQICAVYQLDGLVPLDYNEKRYGQVDVNELLAAKERLTQAKNMWNRIAGGDSSAAEQFELEMHMLAEASSKLNSAPLTKLLRELKGIARHAAHTRPGDMLGLELATSLLFVENALGQIGRLPDNFAERASAMTARLLTVVSGEQPSDAAQWLDDMSREAQQRQTMAALVGEMQASLRQVEKILDEYFRDPAQSISLNQLDLILHQIEGALAVLEHDEAIRTVQHTRAAVQRFAAAESSRSADPQEFQQVAQNVGALSFFIEMLQTQPQNARKRFLFDEKNGLFRAHLVDQNLQVEPVADTNRDEALSPIPEYEEPASSAAIDPDVALATVEDELAYHQQQSIELAKSLAGQPDNPHLHAQLKEALEQVRLDAKLVDNPDATARAKVGIDILERADFSASQEMLVDILAVGATTVSAPQPIAPIIAPTTDEAIDAELLAIFLTEAEEVLACIKQTIPCSRNEPYNQEHLTTLRRSFHTLKGSGRMVGLISLGEAAWSIEQVLNLRLSEARGGDADLYALIDKAVEILDGWVKDLQVHGGSEKTADAIVSAAERVKAGGSFQFDVGTVAPCLPEEHQRDHMHVIAADLDVTEASMREDAPEEFQLELPTSVMSAMPGSDMEVEACSNGQVSQNIVQADLECGNSLTEVETSVEPASDAIHITPKKVISDEAGPTCAIGTAELVETSPSISNAEFVVSSETNHEAALPQAMDLLVDMDASNPVAKHKLHDNFKRIGDLEISTPLHAIYLAETDNLLRILSQDIAEWRHDPERGVNIQSVHAAHSLAGSSSTVGFKMLHEVAHALEMVLQLLARHLIKLTPHDYDVLEHSVERLKGMVRKFAVDEMPAHHSEYTRLLTSLRLSIEARLDAAAEPVGFASVAGAVADLPTAHITENSQVEHAVEKEELLILAPELNLANVLETSQARRDEKDHSVSFLDTSFANDSEDSVHAVQALNDELDADLLPVFLEEGRDMLPQVGPLLRSWQGQLTNPVWPQSLLRLLHTLKGSARMAGAMGLGQHLHDMESSIENIMRVGLSAPQAIEDLLIRYDQGLQLFEQLQIPSPCKPTHTVDGTGTDRSSATENGNSVNEVVQTPVVLSPLIPLPKSASSSLHVSASTSAPVTSAPVQLVRVRADILDRLVNQAGEVSISRSKLETDVGTLRQSLSELTENVTRLRNQLREIEMQAETQITSRMAHSADREFDPLEFDRFTRLQELTRMMAESVNDVSSVHQHLSRSLDSASTGLTAQARLTRDLQQDLMRVRMVQFASISERLFRVTRQAAKEVDKRVNLDIRGSAVEIDRSLLEKMTGPFEHLLRNAVVHGIETRDVRRALGKNEVGELLIEIRQEGNEVMLQFSDDGQGLDLGRIREKAKQIGLLTSDNEISDEEVKDLIFHPGFSTAEEVTELAGRGVGMDVVRSEAAALGGRVTAQSQLGRGTQFTIHLPLTLAVTQVVLLSSGGKTYAIPSALVEQVQQLKTNPLAAAYNDGAVQWQGQRVPLYYLPALLGDTVASPVTQHYSPIMILRGGNERVAAIHVDEIIGNREVVVKNIGPQLARLVGIAGATVLGSGDIVLIINPIPLAQRAAQDNIRAPRLTPSNAPSTMGAVMEMAGLEPMAPRADPVQGLRRQNIVMVVDDSLTVRRVTQRLLTREGYQVVLAKDGVDALEHLQSVTPDVMLVDIEMPRMDGFDLTRNVRGDERTRHIPIIMITSRTATKHRNYALELGVNEYLGKPYQEEELLGYIASFIQKEAPIA